MLILLFLLLAPPGAAADSLYVETRPAMGTDFSFYLYASDAQKAASLFEVAFAEVERVEALLSTYRPTSEFSRLNRDAAREAVTLSPEVFALLNRVLRFSEETGGAFDPTVGALVDAWGFFRGKGRLPDEASLAEARAHTGWKHVLLAPATRSLRFDIDGLRLDPGAFGKGYALDRIADLFRSAQVTAALLRAGGSTHLALGAPPGKEGWPIVLASLSDPQHPVATILLRDQSISTSGDEVRFFELNGRRYSHIIDPRTGDPVEGILQTTVIAPSAETADLLSTAVFVLGPDAAETFLERHPGTGALLVIGQRAAPITRTIRWPASLMPAASIPSHTDW